MSLKTMEDLLTHELKDLYSAERQIVEALPKMAKAASSPELRKAFEEHLEETQGQVERLKKAFKLLDIPARASKCKGMEGLLTEGEEMIKEKGDEAVKDAGLIAAAQRVEHYEMAAYGSAVAFAEQVGNKEIAKLLQETLDEEKAADAKLSKLAESEINAAAS